MNETERVHSLQVLRQHSRIYYCQDLYILINRSFRL